MGAICGVCRVVHFKIVVSGEIEATTGRKCGSIFRINNFTGIAFLCCHTGYEWFLREKNNMPFTRQIILQAGNCPAVYLGNEFATGIPSPSVFPFLYKL